MQVKTGNTVRLLVMRVEWYSILHSTSYRHSLVSLVLYAVQFPESITVGPPDCPQTVVKTRGEALCAVQRQYVRLQMGSELVARVTL